MPNRPHEVPTHHWKRGFTLVELLVVIGIIAVLLSLLLPAMSMAWRRAQSISCLSNLHQIGVAIHAYANDWRGRIPYGPTAPRLMAPTDFYTSTGAPTSLLSIKTGAPVGVGLLLERYLAATPRVLFCPGADQPFGIEDELAKVGIGQSQCSYYYRHGSVTLQYDTPASSRIPPDHIILARLGDNRNQLPIRALVMDTQFPAPPGLEPYGILPRTHHNMKWSNVLYADGSAASLENTDGRFNVDLSTYYALQHAFEVILTAIEKADPGE